MKEWMVEHDYTDTPYGKRPEWIHIFKTEREAIEFAATTADGQVFETVWVEQ